MNLYTEKSAFADALKSIVKCGKRLDRAIQQFAVSAILHGVQHGNVCHVNDLIENMPKGSRVNAVRDWFKTFGPVEYDKKTKKFVIDTALAAIGKAELDAGATLPALVAASVLIPWTDFSPEPPYAPIDFAEMILKAVNMAQKRLDANENKGDKIDVDLLSNIKSLIATS